MKKWGHDLRKQRKHIHLLEVLIIYWWDGRVCLTWKYEMKKNIRITNIVSCVYECKSKYKLQRMLLSNKKKQVLLGYKDGAKDANVVFI